MRFPGTPAPLEMIRWQMAETFGWTLDYIDSLSVGQMHEWLAIQDARASIAAQRKK